MSDGLLNPGGGVMTHGVSRLVLVAALAGLFAGCGGSDRVPTYPVSGRVTINGKPPEGWVAILHLEPPPPSLGEYPHPLPRADVGPDGQFQFHTYATNDGAPAGTYKISFIDVKSLNVTEDNTPTTEDDKIKREKSPSSKKQTRQVYWPNPIEIRPEPNELPPFDIKTK